MTTIRTGIKRMILIIILNIRKLKISLQAKSEKKFLNLVFATKLEIFLFI